MLYIQIKRLVWQNSLLRFSTFTEASFSCTISVAVRGLRSSDAPGITLQHLFFLITTMSFFHDEDFVKTAGDLLKIPVEELLESLRIRTITAGKQQQVFKKPCSRAECETRRDCLAKVIYAK